jgi:hypothetical protein
MSDPSLARIFMDNAKIPELSDKVLADNYRGYISFAHALSEELKRRGYKRADKAGVPVFQKAEITEV